MKAAENAGNTEIDAYLAAVRREASALPPERGQELLADLAEHIEVALAERPDALDEVLRELGDPRTIAATALAESGVGAGAGAGAGPGAGNPVAPPAKQGFRDKVPALLPVLLIALSLPLGFAVLPLGTIGRLAGLVLLWVATCWRIRDKAIATFLAFVTTLGINVAVYYIDPPNPTVVDVISAVQIVLALLAAGWLWATRRR
ncbi:HAAS signaling domain-containing protein [Streptomyces sp. Da 82-17]|uniref:HAAS signaling domain-containing protein n=1 Tax=Streptomyces sp. Da 82-17 TaxID=3377116 RepID=UPI0038D416FF